MGRHYDFGACFSCSMTETYVKRVKCPENTVYDYGVTISLCCMPFMGHNIKTTNPDPVSCRTMDNFIRRAQWLWGRASDSRLREPGFGSCAAELKSWASVFTLRSSSSLSCMNEFLAIDSERIWVR